MQILLNGVTQTYAVHKLAEIVDTTVDELAETLQLKYLGDVDPQGDRRSKVGCIRSKVLTQRHSGP
jgi:hypothetical protein